MTSNYGYFQYGTSTSSTTSSWTNSSASNTSTASEFLDYFGTTTTGTTSYVPTYQTYKVPYYYQEYKPHQESREYLEKRQREELKRIREHERKLHNRKWLCKWLDKKREREERIEREEREIANKKARELLLEYLDEENKAKLTQKKAIEVKSGLFDDIKYLIPDSFNRIKAIKNNKVISELCIRVNNDMPEDDTILTKLLFAKNDEETMIRTANHFNVQESLIARLN